MEKYAVPNKLPAKQVSILARRKKRIARDESKGKVLAINRRLKLKRRGEQLIRPEALIMKYRRTERDAKRVKRAISKNNFLQVPAEKSKLLLVMRHRGKKVASPNMNTVFKLFRLKKLHSCVFIEMTSKNMALLRLVEPYVVWGSPSIGTVRDLIFKCGALAVDGKRTIIQSNNLVEEQLGEHGVICVEDIIHEVFTMGKHFAAVTAKLYPFSINAPRDGWKKKIGVSYSRGGEYGNRKDKIDELMKRCV